MAGEIRKEQLRTFTVTSPEIPEVDAEESQITNLPLSALSSEVSSRLLSEPTEWMSQKDALDASELPTATNPYVTLSQMNKEISTGEYSTWRLPVDTVSQLADLEASKNREGDVRLVKGVGVYEWTSSFTWSPILQTEDIFSYTSLVTLNDQQSSIVRHDADANFTRVVQVFEKITEATQGVSSVSPWRSLEISRSSAAYGSLALSQALGTGGVNQGKLVRDTSTESFNVWSKGLQGLRLFLDEGSQSLSNQNRIQVSKVDSGQQAWLQYETLVYPTVSGRTEVDARVLEKVPFEFGSIEVYNDVRLVEKLLWDRKQDLDSTLVDMARRTARVFYCKDQSYIFLTYLASTGGYLITYNRSLGTVSSPISIAPSAIGMDACTETTPQGVQDELRFAYILSDNSVQYNKYSVTSGLGTPETVAIASTETRSPIRIAQGGNLQPIIVTKEGPSQVLGYRCRTTGGGWNLYSESEPNILGYDVSSAPGLSVIYVKQNATGAQNGSSWNDGFRSLRDALDNAVGYSELWVASGEYSPGTGAQDSFVLQQGIELYGGFVGNETSRSQRNFRVNQTILTGNGVNYHVIRGSDNCVLDGFTIKNGKATGTADDGKGGGIFCKDATPTIRNCILMDNEGLGGAIYIEGSGSRTVKINESVFRNNRSLSNPGGAIYNGTGGRALAINCLFIENSAPSGGAIYHDATASYLRIVNSTLNGNLATMGDGDCLDISGPSATVINSILWGQYAAGDAVIRVGPSGNINIDYCDSKGGQPAIVVVSGGTLTYGVNNIDSDPKFNSSDIPAGPDGVLATRDDGLRLKIGSPCLEVGSSSVETAIDLLDDPRPTAGLYDLGCYQGAITGTRVLYVDRGASGLNDGTTWSNAFIDLTGALTASTTGDELWVKAGNYTSAGLTSYFTVPANVSLYGGFVGTELSRDQRDYYLNATILNGQIGSNYCTNSIIRAGDGARVDGFVIKNGHAATNGGAMVLDNVSPTVANCFFETNTANTSLGKGGAIAIINTATPTFITCDFKVNQANLTNGQGGAIYIDATSSTTLDRCVFYKNKASTGGAICDLHQNSTITNCMFITQQAGIHGGGCIYHNDSLGGSPLVVKNSTFFFNKVDVETVEVPTPEPHDENYMDGATLYIEAGTVQLVNNILWNDDPDSSPILDRYNEIFVKTGATLRIGKTDLKSYPAASWTFGIYGGGSVVDELGNLSINPVFESPSDVTSDLHPAGTDGRYRTDDDPLRLRATSPVRNLCVLPGAPTLDIRGAIRSPTGALIDMGSYEYGAVYPPIIPAPDFGMIPGSRFGIVWAKSDGGLRFLEFSWDGAIKTQLQSLSLATGEEKGKVTGAGKFAFAYWSDGSQYNPEFYQVLPSSTKVLQGTLSPEAEWKNEVVAEETSSLVLRTSIDNRRLGLLRESTLTPGRMIYHHTEFGWNSKDRTGRLVLSPPFPITRDLAEIGLSDIAIPALHSPQSLYVNSYVKQGATKVTFRLSDPFYSYDNWTPVGPPEWDQESEKPSPRSTPIMYHQTSESLWLFGGRGVSSSKQAPVFSGQTQLLSGLWRYDLSVGAWTTVITTSSIAARSNHALSGNDTTLYLVGGYSALDTTLDPSVVSVNWSRKTPLTVGSLNPTFAEAATWSQGVTVYVFGGLVQSGSSLVVSNQVRKIDPSTVTSGFVKNEVVNPNAPSDTLPALRAACVTKGVDGSGNEVFFLYGGYDGSALRNELYQVRIQTLSGQLKYTKTLLSSSGNSRKGASLFYFEDSGSRYLLAVGGQSNTNDDQPTYQDDVYLFNLQTNAWSDVTPASGESPPAGAYCGIARYQGLNKFYFFGGRDGTERKANGLLNLYEVPTFIDGVFPQRSGSVTKKRGYVWVQALDTAEVQSLEAISIPVDGYSLPPYTSMRLAIGFGGTEAAWIYRSGLWQALSLDNIMQLGLTLTELSQIPAQAWAGKFLPGTHQAIYLLVGMVTLHNQSSPSLSSIQSTYRTPEQYKSLSSSAYEILLTGVSETTVKNTSGESTPKTLRVSVMGKRG